MDKRKVILAYQKGFITLHECAQIMGIDSMQIMGLVNDPKSVEPSKSIRSSLGSR